MTYGQLWYGPSGFLYKKNIGAGGRRSTRFHAGGNNICSCNTPTEINNTYTPGAGVGASSISSRRAKRNRSTACNISK